MKNPFQGIKESPFHISVGVVLTNEEGKIAVHLHKKENLPVESEGKRDIYILMRETLHPRETVEEAVSRGLKEEFGASGVIRNYIGSIKSLYPLRKSAVEVEKTTLYFHVEVVDFNPEMRMSDDAEHKSEVLWLSPGELIEIYKQQSSKYERTDLDESEIVENYIKYAK